MMATDEFNSSYGYLLKLMVNTPPLAFLSPSLLSVPRLILTNIQREPPNPSSSNPHSSCCQAERRLPSACPVHQRIRRMHCLVARRRVRHSNRTEIRSRLSRSKKTCDVAGFSTVSHERMHKIGDNSEDRSRCRRRRRRPHVSHGETTSPFPGGAWSPGRRGPRHWIVGGCLYHPLTEQQQEE